jgi:hypothetical protein
VTTAQHSAWANGFRDCSADKSPTISRSSRSPDQPLNCNLSRVTGALCSTFAVALAVSKEGSTVRRFLRWVRDTTFADGVVALFTAALFLASAYQFIILNGQLDVMRKDQRAWITAVPGIPETPENGDGKTLRVPITLTNTGKSSARDVEVRVIVSTVKNGDQPKCEYGKQILETRRTVNVFQPNAPRTINAAILSAAETDKSTAQPGIVSPDEIQRLTDGSDFFVIYGQVNYKDLFRKEHWVHFCSFGNLNESKIMMVTAKTCADYNDLDDN